MNVNELQSLPRYAFAGLLKLDILDLEFNNLTTLPDGLFAGLNLRFLGLEGNQLHTLRAGMFDALGGNLILDLSHSALKTLEDGAFADLGDLVWLDLAHNWLRTLPTGVFAGLFNMRSLYLERNPGADFTFTMTIERVPGTELSVVGQRVRGDVAVPEVANTRQAKAGLEALAHWVRGEEEDRTEAFASRQVTVRWRSWAVRPVPHVRRLECGETVHLRSGHREVRDMRAELASVGRRYRPARPGADGPGSGRGDGRRR